MVRRLYALGTAHVPETAPLNRHGSDQHRCLEAVWASAAESRRLWYAPSDQGEMDGPPGSCFGLYALKYALHGTACEGMDQRIIHVSSLDSCFDKNVEIKKVTGCGPVRLVLLSNGVLVTMSENPEHHGVVVPCPDPDANITDVAAGEGHYVLCDSAGAVYTWGWDNSFGQLGRGSVHQPDPALVGVHEPRRLGGFGSTDSLPTSRIADDGSAPSVFESRRAPNIVAVDCGRHHTVMLTDTGNAVYTFGRGHCGQLGLGRPDGPQGAAALRRVEVVPTPRCVPCVFGAPVRRVVCANDAHSTMAVLTTGEVVVWGDNTMGAFGLGHTKTITVPTTVSLPPQAPPAADGTDTPPPNTSGAASAGGSNVSRVRARLPGPLEPRRIKKLVSASAGTAAASVTVQGGIEQASTCLTHSALTDGSGRLLTAGLRPVRVATDSMPVNALGALGRRPESKADALTFSTVSGIMVDTDDRIACGDGYTAYLMRRQGLVFLVGSIAVEGKVLVGGGEEAHDLFNVSTGVGRRVVDIRSTCNGGLLMLVDDDAA